MTDFRGWWHRAGNDFGESSYICDPKRPTQVVPGAEKYVIGHSHDAFRATLPYFIRLYKAAAAGEGAAVPEEDSAVAWYRTTLASCGHDGGTLFFSPHSFLLKRERLKFVPFLCRYSMGPGRFPIRARRHARHHLRASHHC